MIESSRFKEILLPLGARLYKIAYRIVGDADTAKDMVQEAYLSMWKRRETLDELENVESFAVKVVKNRCVDFLRTQRMYCSINDEVRNIIEIEKNYEQSEKLNRVMLMMNSLPERQKQVLMMRSVQDLSLEEIEQITGLTGVNIRTLLSRARKKLKEMCEIEINW